MAEVDEQKLRDLFPLARMQGQGVYVLGMVDSNVPNTLALVSDLKYVSDANENPNVSLVLTTADLSISIARECIISDTPLFSFWSLFNECVERANRSSRLRTVISEGVTIANSAFVADNGVVIGAGTVLEENVVVYPGVEIGRNCRIRTGSVLGSDGFEKKRTERGILSIMHDGRLVIGDDVEVGVLNSIAKGFCNRDTVIGNETKIDSLVHIGHCIQIGRRCLITAGAIIGGSVKIGDDCWIGLNSTIKNSLGVGDSAFVGLGSVVIRAVDSGSKVAGNPARGVVN
jgi:UDP-3-O-[3-hydroxymyristoyl] glucosamine N-acyltransferase LpxD